jgi:hypothetical protein
MITYINGSDCEYKFNKIYSSKILPHNTISNFKKTNSSESLQSFESNVIEHEFINSNETSDTITNKIKFKILDDIDSININSDDSIELSIALPLCLNIIFINKIKLSKKINIDDINIFSDNKIIYNKDDIFSSNYNNCENNLKLSHCNNDIFINIKVNSKNINKIIGKYIQVSYTKSIIKKRHMSNISH